MTNYMYTYRDWKFEIMDVSYGETNVVIMKHKGFPLMEYSFKISGEETGRHDLAMNVISKSYTKITEALLYLKLQTIGVT